MASTTQHDPIERLSRQGGGPPRRRRFPFLLPPRLRLRGLSWRRLLGRLPLYAGMIVAVAALALVSLGSVPQLFGYHAFIVYGGSMAPALRPGDVALAKPVAAEDVHVGDIIATSPNAQVTPTLHRVTAIEEESGQRQAITKGDRNDGVDPEPVVLTGTGDRVVHRVPFAGYLIHFARTLPGRLLFLVLPALFLGGMIVWDIWRPRRTEEAPPPILASEGPEPEARPVTVPFRGLELVMPDPPGPPPEARPGVSAPSSARTAVSGVPKGAKKTPTARRWARKARPTGRRVYRRKRNGRGRAAA